MMHNQTAPQESPVRSYQCSHCVLIFKTKLFLLEHLSNVHGFNVEAALKDAGLTSTGTDKSSAVSRDTSSERSGERFVCQHCDFEAFSWDIIVQHEKKCCKLKEGLIFYESQEKKLGVNLSNQHVETAGEKETSSLVKGASKIICTSSSSKDLKVYKKQSESCSTFLDESFGSNENSPESRKSPYSQVPPDGLQGTLILQDSHSNSNTSSDGVFKVTATSKIDSSTPRSYCSFLNDHLLNTKSSSPKFERKFKEPFPNQVGKRTSIESSRCSPAKKPKVDEDVPKLPANKASKLQLASNTAFSCDVGEDEAREVDVLHEEIKNSTVYFCKHCNFSDVGIQSMSTHYQTKHPYVRCNAEYIQDPGNQSATFCCLECPFECFTLSDLEGHHAENHPGALKSGTSPCKEVNNSSLPQHSTSKGVGAALYQCANCNFSHKSVVVMHVHYQKSHPDEEVSIDKIKQSVRALPQPKLQMTPEKSSESPSCDGNTTAMESSPSKDDASDYSENTRDKDEKSHKTPLPVLKLSLKPEAPKDHVGSSTKKNVEFEEDSSESALPVKRKRRSSTLLNSLSFIPKINMFYCQFCSYCNTNVKSVLGHHNAKHSLLQVITTDDVVQYSVEVQNRKAQSEAKSSAASTASDASTVKQGALNCDAEEVQHDHVDEDILESEINPYAHAEDLFYCQKCNFAHPNVRGVLKHQSKLHPNLQAHTEQILTHTRLICDDIENSKSQAEKSFFSTGLPLPLYNASDESKLFCYLCNFRQKTMKRVLQHYSKSHCGFKLDAKQVHLYSSLVHRKICKSRPETAATREDKLEIDEKGGNKKAETDTPGKSASVSPSAPQTPRTIQCNRCIYNTQYAYLLKRHIKKIHKSNRTITDILRMGFRQGALQSGYHCEMCVFSHKKAAVVYRHLKELHPGRGVSLEYVATRLYVGPRQSSHKKNLNSKHADGDNTDNSDEQCEESESKIYSCKACPYKDSSLSSMTSHYRAVHPWSVKEDGSVLDVISSVKQSGNRQEDHDSCDVNQTPPEGAPPPEASSQATKSSGLHKCHFCSMSFQTQRGLNIHCSLKHSEALTESANEPEGKNYQTEQVAGVHVFQCPYCTYVNTIYQGILTHCQMMHPDLTARAESVQLDETQLPNVEYMQKPCPDGRMKFCGYMCKNCPAVYESSKKLKKHREKDHNEVVPHMQKSAPAPSTTDVKQPSDSLSTQGSKLQSAFFKKKKYAVIKCKYCKYITSTKLALSRHMSLHHKTAPEAEDAECMFKCDLCSRSFSMKHHLGCHYTKKHGKDAFMKHYVPVYQQVQKKPAVTSPDSAVSEKPKASSETCASSTPSDEKRIIYKCPRCTYVNTSHHGTLTHCQMLHPSFVARTDNLQTEEVEAANLLRCRSTKGSNRSGYACKICPQIVASMKKLRKHYEKDHNQTVSNAIKAAPKHSVVIKKQLLSKYHGPQRTVLKAAFFKNKKMGLNHSLHLQNKSASGAVDHGSPYACVLCSYSSIALRHLRIHYTHKHGKGAILKYAPLYAENLLESPSANDSAAPESESATETCESDTMTVAVECRKCPNLLFNSFQLLSTHYITFHSSDCKLDFTILPRELKTKRTYRCGYCKKKLHGTRKLSRHLDRHRQRNIKKGNDGKTKAPAISETEPEAQCVDRTVENALPTFESIAEMTEAAPMEYNESKDSSSGSVVSSSPSSPSSHTDDGKSQGDKYACKDCGRTYVFLSCLRMHERSHAAVAALNRQDSLRTSLKQHTFSKYILYKTGTTRPFLCGICSYRTTVIGLLKSHFVKKHGDIVMDLAETKNQSEESSQMTDEKSPCSSVEVNSLSDLDEDAEDTEKSQYLEPPDVQRQLNQYNLMAHASATANMNLQETRFFEDSLLYCEFCNFNTEHLSSIRRHYLNRHGKKIHKCKDCCFYTGLRNKLEKHMADGHSTWHSQSTHEKDLRCPFCLYRSKNKNNMIDHIVLHRDERVVPIEVRRPKLSRYLQGVIFRCHKCTFTSGSAENLCAHMKRHDDKPFRCRLCYFDCIQLSDLEAHLCDKHQVLRNHELVGQISLDQLEARVRKTSEEEEPLSNVKELGDVETEMNVQWQDAVGKTTVEEKGANRRNENCDAQFDDVPHQTTDQNTEENCTWDMAVQNAEAYQRHMGHSKNENSGDPAESSVSTIRCEKDAAPSIVVQLRLEPHSQGRERTQVVIAAVKEQDREKIVEQSREGNKTEDGNSKQERIRDAKKKEWMDGSLEQPQERNSGDGVPQPTEEAARGISAKSNKRAESAEACGTYHGLQNRTIKTEPDLETEVEEDILRQILLLDEEGRIPNLHMNAVHCRKIKLEEDIESSVEDNVQHQQVSENVDDANPEKQCELKTCIKPTTPKESLTMAKNIRVQECFTAANRWLSAGVHSCEQFQKSHQRRCDREDLGARFTNRKEEEASNQKNRAEVTDPYGEMPVLENEYVKEEMCLLGQREEEERNNHFQQKQIREEKVNSDDDKSPCEDQGYTEGKMKEFSRATVGAADLTCPSAEAFTCRFCGRNLLNSAELERHMMRHGL